ncbi:MAG: D-amino acid aminotransferase, partial [Methylococcales bacterium]|nr:D-amino acid aminotransferase [Methylococcales bacterium]
MTKIAYINGEFLAESEAKLSIFDRGFLFGDGIYEVVSVVGGKLIDVEPHLDRLYRSMREIGLRTELTHTDFTEMLLELTVRNHF